MPGKFWTEFENFLGYKFPSVLKDILTINGLNNLAFEFIDTNTIDNLEKVVDKNKDILKKSDYEKNIEEPFKFSFGHRLLLLNIPKKYKEFIEFGRNKKTARKQRLIELKESECHSNNTPEHLISLLLNKVNNYSDKFHLGYKITRDNVKKFNQKESDALCVVKCPFCDVKVPCSLLSTWRISNFNNHVKTHLGFETIEPSFPIPTITTASIETTTAASAPVVAPESTENTVILSIQRARSNVLEEIDKYILNSSSNFN